MQVIDHAGPAAALVKFKGGDALVDCCPASLCLMTLCRNNLLKTAHQIQVTSNVTKNYSHKFV